MNFIQNLIDRQLGNCCRFSYDNVLKRLKVDSEENYYGLMNSELARLTGPLEHDPPIFACRFAEAPGCEHILALANENGRVAIQNTYSTSTASSFDGYQCHNDAVFDLVWMPGDMKFVTVSADHTACLWDAGGGGGAPRRLAVFSHHTKSVKTAAFRPRGGAVFATGARDGHVLVWDARAPPAPPALVLRPDNCLAGCHAARHAARARLAPGPARAKRPRPPAPRPASITGLVFRDADALVSCGENDGNIKVWDLRKNYRLYTREPLPKHSIPYCGSSTKNGYTNLALDEARGRLYASCMDDVIYCFNVAAESAQPLQRYVGHENSTFYIKAALSADGAYLASGSSDHRAYVWNVECPEPVVQLVGHRAEVTCAAWGRRGTLLATAGDDARHRLWRVGPERGAGDGAGAGHALPAPRAAARPRWGGADTPASAERAPPADAERWKRPDAAVSKTKRRLVDLMHAPGDDEPTAAKRMRPEEVAAAAGEPGLLPAGVKRRWSAGEPAPAPAPGPGPGPAPALGPPRTPPRTPPRRSPRGSPQASPRRSPRLATPTKNLPDFVRTGEAPHLRLMSPLKRRVEAPDWLTLMARGKRSRGATEAPPPTPREGPAGGGSPSTRPLREGPAGGGSPSTRPLREGPAGGGSPSTRPLREGPAGGGSPSTRPLREGPAGGGSPSTRPPREGAARAATSAEKTSRPGCKDKPLLKYFTVKNKK